MLLTLWGLYFLVWLLLSLMSHLSVYERHLDNDIGSHLLAFSPLSAGVYAPWLLSRAGATITTIERLPGSVNFPFCYSFAFPNLIAGCRAKSQAIRAKVLGDNPTRHRYPNWPTAVGGEGRQEPCYVRPTHDDHRKHIPELRSMSVMPISSRMTQLL